MKLLIAVALVCLACEEPETQPRATEPPGSQAPEAPQGSGAPQAPEALLGAWSADGQTFTWVIDADSILFEIDMRNHPYTMSGDTLLIDRGDPAIGIQKTRVLRGTADTLVIQDVISGTSEALIRLR